MHAVPEQQVRDAMQSPALRASTQAFSRAFRYMDNPVFIAMEMPRFEIIIKNTSSSVESLADGPRSSSAEAARYVRALPSLCFCNTLPQVRRRAGFERLRGLGGPSGARPRGIPPEKRMRGRVTCSSSRTCDLLLFQNV